MEEVMGEMGDDIDDKQLKEPAVLTDWQLPFTAASLKFPKSYLKALVSVSNKDFNAMKNRASKIHVEAKSATLKRSHKRQ
ncbi:hypothetical protein [Polaromonas vacuolata]|uniref:hypothetical protein n=1 Tax=Polaromonas vacuolata TaxID=37448 RepID=UPI00145739D0|nr:hypothetical protein [Polaromonas vacuolata]